MNTMPERIEYPARMVPRPPQEEPEAEDLIDLRALFLTLWRGKWIVMVCVFIAAVLSILAVSQMPPRFYAGAKVFFDPPQLNVIDLTSVMTNPEFDQDSLQNQVEILSSTTLIDRVAQKLDLKALPEFNPMLQDGPSLIDTIKDALLPGSLKAKLMDLGVMSPPAPPMSAEQSAAIERLLVIDQVRNHLILTPVVNSRVIEIGFTSENAERAAKVVNTMAGEYIYLQLDAKLDATRDATNWLSVRVDELRDRVQEAEEAVESTRSDLALAGGQGLEVSQQQLDDLNGELAVTRNNLLALEARYNRVSDSMATGADYGAVSEFRNSPVIQNYRAQESELLSRRALLAPTVKAGHPALQRLDAQLGEIRRNLQKEGERIARALRSDLEAAQEQETALVAQVRQLEEKVLEQSGKQVRLRQLEREAEASRVLYENFLNRMKETAEQQDLQTADARVLSPAEVPLNPGSGRKKVIVLGATMLGGFIGIGVVFLLEHLNNTFRNPRQVEALTGLGVLSTLPTAGNKKKRIDVLAAVRSRPNSGLAEAIRNLRTSILYSNVDHPPRVVMFTSTTPKEGKTTTSMLVAMASRQMGRSAIIVDCDLRLPALATLIEQDDGRPGLLSVLEGVASVDDARFVDEETGLHVLMARASERKAHINAADILASNRFRALVNDLAAAYDLVILDTPPALVVTDARIISSHADAVVYAVRWDHTPRGAVLEGLRELRSVNAPLAGIVLTMVNETKAGKYAYDSYGYYKGKYTDYYGK
ncbi:hypothetical protein FDP22_22925 (plasmid) [Paroceanicella profunda]|uniref:non-specific protein-tyrosine kinase n=1 Tax=Paroceanicella profunda TaxID=2579971 RepID=A0A5B8G5H9_9RHOB|nr:polysaccharide biosynthesis tyrosine autokinase [Paroceanicella profunda]QDL94729.1 hypothetical protein FDP22_22925 [Paroceanicella profunda]